MAIDIRAKTACSLGILISGEIGDDYLQGSGLIKTRGSCEIAGLITPAVGTKVIFSYTKNGITRNIPRALRVLSSFADPFRRTTKVELGCKLTYLSDLQEPIKWEAFDDPANQGFTADDQAIITLPISASSVMNQCLSKLGITASQNPLTNKFSIAEFDFSSGYVQVLSDILVSESYFGYLDVNEILQVISLSQEGGSGPVLNADEIIDVGPIGVGQLPGEAVVVSYSSLRLKAPELQPASQQANGSEAEQELQRINWEYDETKGSSQSYFVNYKTRGSTVQKVKEYSGRSYSTTFTRYKTIQIQNTQTKKFEQKEVVATRFTKLYGPSISIGAALAKVYLENGFDFNNVMIQLSGTNEFYNYLDNGSKIAVDKETFKTRAEQVSSLGIDLSYTSSEGTPPRSITEVVTTDFGLIVTELEETSTDTIGNATRESTVNYKLLADTQHGQQAIAGIRETTNSVSEANNVISNALNGLVFDSSRTQFRTSGRAEEVLPARPRPAERINEQYAKGGNPNNGWKTESKAELELALGSATAQRRVEFSMPYAPDDVFFKYQIGGGFNAVFTFYQTVRGDASVKANRYGRVQNRLLLGNRNGINLQVAPEKMPIAPFQPVYVNAAGLTSLYRTNGCQWAFDSNGIISSTDALYWGVAGKAP